MQGLLFYGNTIIPFKDKFEKTYNTAGASHVGIYVGNGMMIHCGDPISYTSINSTYWQSHFLGFGRIN